MSTCLYVCLFVPGSLQSFGNIKMVKISLEVKLHREESAINGAMLLSFSLSMILKKGLLAR